MGIDRPGGAGLFLVHLFQGVNRVALALGSLQSFKHPQLHPKLSLWPASAAFSWLVAPFIVRHADLSSGPNVVAGFALTLSTDGLFARVA